MWIILSEVIIFWIILSLFLGHFLGFWLWINKEIRFTENYNHQIKLIKEKINNYNHNNSDNLKYKITRLVSYDNEKTYRKYVITILNSSWDAIDPNKFEKVAKAVVWTNTSWTNFSPTSWTKINYKNNLLIYHGRPSYINGANGDIEKAEKEFQKYDKVILADWLQNINNIDYNNTKTIIADLKGKVDFYWTISMLNKWNMTYKKFTDDVFRWKSIWVSWIFVTSSDKDSWSKYMSWLWMSIYKAYLTSTYNFIKLQWLKVIYNSWNFNNLFSILRFSNDDMIIFKNFYYLNWVKKQDYISNINNYMRKFEELIIKPKIMCVATSSKNNQNQVNLIKDEIWNTMSSICDYTTIQDGYGTDWKVLIPTK